jgi:hypothetical protein
MENRDYTFHAPSRPATGKFRIIVLTRQCFSEGTTHIEMGTANKNNCGHERELAGRTTAGAILPNP